jgi:putative transposase
VLSSSEPLNLTEPTGPVGAFPIEGDKHLLTELRSIERNPLRARPIDRAEDWPWSSLQWLSKPEQAPVRLDPGTVPRGSRWVDGVNESSTDPGVERLRECIYRDRPFGSPDWTLATAQRLGLDSGLRPRGRPHRPGAGQAPTAADQGRPNSV